ncbi:MAG: regulatory protein RecX [Bacteroidales bacterium]
MDTEEYYSIVLGRMQAQCSKKECCSSDIYNKAVIALDGDRETAAKLVASLVEDKFLDDYRYACAFARDKSSLSGWGPVKISYMLSAKGIAKDVINSAMEEIDSHKASDKLESILSAKHRLLKEDKDCKLKLLRFALSRGYNYDVVAPIVDNLMRK